MKLLYMTNLLKYFNRKKVCFRHVQPELIPSKILRHLPWFCCTPFEKRQNLSHLWNIIVSQIFNIDWCKNQLILNYLLHFIMYIWSKTEYIYRLFFIMLIINISYPCPFHHFCLFFPRPISRTCKSYIYAYQNNWSQKELVLVEHGESILFWTLLYSTSVINSVFFQVECSRTRANDVEFYEMTGEKNPYFQFW
jgi:hypothetical protein